MGVERTRSSASPLRPPLSRRPSGRRGGATAMVASVLLTFACNREEAKPAHVIVRNPDYLVVRSIKREADAEHTDRVELPYSGAGYGFASDSALLDLNSVNLGAVTFAGGRTSVAGEATLWLPLTPEASRRLETWSTEHAGDYLGVFLKGKLVAAPQVKSRIGGGIPLRVTSKSEGDLVIRELRNGGASQ
jgi:preprotein translocase subunit SecD